MTLPLLFSAEGGDLPAPFSPTVGLFFWTIIVFIPFLIILAKYVFPMIVKATVDRESAINKQLSDAERMHGEAKAALDEQMKLLAGARGEAQALMAEARGASERERAASVEKTKAEQAEMLDRARREIVAEKERAVADLRREAVDIAIAAAGKVVGQRLDAAADRKLVEDYLAQIGNKP
ncbi:MAG: F0F1 ATP synthase subunit B [Gemmatimonadales bacterium]